MGKRAETEYEQELAMWAGLFEQTDDATRTAVQGLIQKAAYLHALCAELEETIRASGAIKVHPEHPDIQKQVPAVKEYTRVAEAYANIVNKLEKLRTRNVLDDDDELEEFA